jgi:tRNA pseudouridine55 synthase
MEQSEGVVLIDKPRGMTSHDVVDRVRKTAGMRRVGHAGTLDPMAEGLLVVCLGPATRIVQFLTQLTKEYIGTIRLGAISSTYDAEGAIVPQPHPLPDDPAAVAEAMNRMRGWRTQLAPPYSAVKVRGKKLYQYAREGGEVPHKTRKVHVLQFELIEYLEPDIRFRACVGSGTYIRSLAHDLGVEFQCGAYLASLRRVRVGGFSIDDAVPLVALMRDPDLLAHRLIGVTDALSHMPKITVGREVEQAVLNGRGFTTREIHFCEALPRPSEESLVLSAEGKALSVVRGELVPVNSRPENADADDPRRVEEAAGVRLLYFRPVRVLGRS